MVNVLVLGACNRPDLVFVPKDLGTSGTTVVTPLQPQVKHPDHNVLASYLWDKGILQIRI